MASYTKSIGGRNRSVPDRRKLPLPPAPPRDQIRLRRVAARGVGFAERAQHLIGSARGGERVRLGASSSPWALPRAASRSARSTCSFCFRPISICFSPMARWPRSTAGSCSSSNSPPGAISRSPATSFFKGCLDGLLQRIHKGRRVTRATFASERGRKDAHPPGRSVRVLLFDRPPLLEAEAHGALRILVANA